MTYSIFTSDRLITRMSLNVNVLQSCISRQSACMLSPRGVTSKSTLFSLDGNYLVTRKAKPTTVTKDSSLLERQ